MVSRTWVAGVAVAVFALSTACSSDDGATQAKPQRLTSPAAEANGVPKASFYQPPSELPAGSHGALIRTQPFDGVQALSGATNTLLLYKQQGIDRSLVATSAFMAVPKGKAPAGGWPVVAWAHGTTGIADECAPTRDADPQDAQQSAPLSALVQLGYAVVSTDYEGLGTPGTHPYLDGQSAGRAILDSVLAARKADSSLSANVVIAGHSQGGQAALWGGSLAASYAPELKLRGTLALAPPSGLSTQLGLLYTQKTSAVSPIASLILRGAQAADPALDVSELLGPKAAALYPQTLTKCLSDLSAAGSFGGIPGNQLLKSDADTSEVARVLGQSDPGQLKIAGPVLIEQGRSDTTVLPIFTNNLVKTLTAGGDQVTYKTYAGATHSSVVLAGAQDAAAFLSKAFAGQ
jgi:alpha-beta hydrolase superfamily lysophospholipase